MRALWKFQDIHLGDLILHKTSRNFHTSGVLVNFSGYVLNGLQLSKKLWYDQHSSICHDGAMQEPCTASSRQRE